MDELTSAFAIIAATKPLVQHHEFNSGRDEGPYFNFTFGTHDAAALWQVVERDIYGADRFGAYMRAASMAMCSSDEGWDHYLLLFHYDPAVKVDAPTAL